MENNVISYGFPGATSKALYGHLFKDARGLMESNPDYCAIIAGVNGSFQGKGERYYSYHISLIETLQHYRIGPLVACLPEYGIKEAYAEVSDNYAANISLYKDGKHLNDLGNANFAALITGNIQEAVTPLELFTK